MENESSMSIVSDFAEETKAPGKKKTKKKAKEYKGKGEGPASNLRSRIKDFQA